MTSSGGVIGHAVWFCKVVNKAIDNVRWFFSRRYRGLRFDAEPNWPLRFDLLRQGFILFTAQLAAHFTQQAKVNDAREGDFAEIFFRPANEIEVNV